MKFLKSIFLKLLILVPLAACSTHEQEKKMDEKADLQYQIAYQAYVAGDLIPALGATLESLKARPENADSKNLLGLIYFRQRKFKEAEDAFHQAGKINPKRTEIWVNLGALYLELKRYPESEAMLQKALENPLYLYPERIYNNLGLAYVGMKKKAEAIQAYERAIELDKDFYLPYQNLGQLHLESGNLKVAEPLLTEAGKLCATCAQPRYFLGTLLLKKNQKSEAIKVFKEGAAADPKSYYGQQCANYLVKDKAL